MRVVFDRNATKFREVHRAKRLALRELERSDGTRLVVESFGRAKSRWRQPGAIASEGDGRIPTNRMPLEAGTRLSPYEILSPLGAGGMGEVYPRFTCSGIWLRHRRAARAPALDRTPDSLAALRSRGASCFARLLRETLSRRER